MERLGRPVVPRAVAQIMSQLDGINSINDEELIDRDLNHSGYVFPYSSQVDLMIQRTINVLRNAAHANGLSC